MHPHAGAPPTASLDTFFALTPDRVLAAVEQTGWRATGRVLALNSLENRVYEVELEPSARDQSEATWRVVAKFYRPGRWSRAAILAEHAFLAELADADLPVVTPLDLGGATLGELTTPVDSADQDARDAPVHPIYFAVFPRIAGRVPDELNDDQLAQLGRLLARLHQVGARHPAPARPMLSPVTYGTASLELLAAGPWIPADLRARYLATGQALVAACTRLWATPGLVDPPLRLHGDCHLGNLLWQPARGPILVDFDDFITGPPVQDLWLLGASPDAHGARQREVLVNAYDSLRSFNRRSLVLVEALRALRILRYAAWIARRYDDPAFQRSFPDFTRGAFWHREIEALSEQLSRLDDAG